MSIRVLAARLHELALVAGILIALLSPPTAGAAAGRAESGAEAPAASLAGPPTLRAPFSTLIARVFVNTIAKGDVPILIDATGQVAVPETEFAKWGLALAAAPVTVKRESYVVVSAVEGLSVRFDPKTVTLELKATVKAFEGTAINLAPQRRAGVIYPADNSFFLNYALNAAGDENFSQRYYQAATELGVRTGNWLFYNTTAEQWGAAATTGFTRLLTNLQYDDRPKLRRLTLGDFFTPAFDLSASVPMGGVSFSKDYRMDPYFIQYPTAGFHTEVEFPSTVQVRMDGNLVAQRQVAPGPIDITNIAGITGRQNVTVTIRDPFGREQVLQQPFFFATNVGLAEGLHEYSYNAGFLRRQYGVESNDYGPFAAAAFHRYAFTNEVTLGLRGQATESLYNIGPFGTYQSPLGIVGGGASIGGSDGHTGAAGSAAYSYTGRYFSLNAAAQYFSRDFAQLADRVSTFRTRSTEYVSGSAYTTSLGTLTATYSAQTSYTGPQTKVWDASYTLGMLGGKGLLSLSYTRTQEPQSTYVWLLSLRYYFDPLNSVVAAVGGGRDANTQSLSLERATPQGEGIGYTLTGGHAGGGGGSGGFGHAFVQANAAHATFTAEYQRASNAAASPGLSSLSVAGSIGAVGGSPFLARPVTDSFVLIRMPGLTDVPVYANGWYAGKTDAAGEVVATNIASYYDNLVSFGTKELPLDYVFESSEKVISPPLRSGTLVSFEVRKNHAVFGVLVELRDGKRLPLEFGEITLRRGDKVIRSFTARRGEFYVEGVEPGAYELRLDAIPACSARFVVADPAAAMTDVGTLVCEPLPG